MCRLRRRRTGADCAVCGFAAGPLGTGAIRKPSQPPWLIKRITFEQMDGAILGEIGEIHPKIQKLGSTYRRVDRDAGKHTSGHDTRSSVQWRLILMELYGKLSHAGQRDCAGQQEVPRLTLASERARLELQPFWPQCQAPYLGLAASHLGFAASRQWPAISCQLPPCGVGGPTAGGGTVGDTMEECAAGARAEGGVQA